MTLTKKQAIEQFAAKLTKDGMDPKLAKAKAIYIAKLCEKQDK